MNNGVIFWLIVAVVLGMIEAATANLVTVWAAIAALAAAVCAAFGAGGYALFAVFVVVTAVLLILTRPLAKRIMLKKAVPTNADRIIGAEGIVTERIKPLENKGQIKVMGQVWSAKSADDKVIEVGTKVTVTALEGVKAVVAPCGSCSITQPTDKSTSDMQKECV